MCEGGCASVSLYVRECVSVCVCVLAFVCDMYVGLRVCVCMIGCYC